MPRKFGEGESKYLKSSDLEREDGSHMEPVVTIESLVQETLGDGPDKDDKWIVYFAGKQKGMALNVTNERNLIALYGEPTGSLTDYFRGKRVQLYVDPNVMYGGKRTGGLRLRAAPAASAPAASAPAPEPEMPPVPSDDDYRSEDEIPF